MVRSTRAARSKDRTAWLIFERLACKDLAKIDGVPITEDDVNDALEDIGPGLPQKLDGPARQQYALDYLIDMKLVANFHSVAFLELGSYDAFRSRIRKPPALVEPPPPGRPELRR